MRQVHRLLGFLKPYLLRFLVAFFLMAMVGACEGLTALLIKPIFDYVLGSSGGATPVVLVKFPWSGHEVYLQSFLPSYFQNAWAIVLISIVGVTLVKGISEFFANYSINFVGFSVVRDLRNLVYARIVAQSVAFFSKQPTGNLMSAITSDIEKIQMAVSTAAADFLKQIFTLAFLLAVLFYFDWRLATISFLLVPFVVFPSINIGRRIRVSSRFSQDRMAELNSILQESFTGIRIVKAFGAELLEIKKFKAATQRLLKVNLRWMRASVATSPLMEVLGAVTIAALLFYARYQIAGHTQTTGGFIAFLYALIKMYEPIKRLTGIHNSFQQAVGASEQAFHLLDLPPEIADQPGAIVLPPFQREISFENAIEIPIWG